MVGPPRVGKKGVDWRIYYDTPLPLNLANNNNKQQQARLCAVLATAMSQRFGSFAHAAILDLGGGLAKVKF